MLHVPQDQMLQSVPSCSLLSFLDQDSLLLTKKKQPPKNQNPKHKILLLLQKHSLFPQGLPTASHGLPCDFEASYHSWQIQLLPFNIWLLHSWNLFLMIFFWTPPAFQFHGHTQSHLKNVISSVTSTVSVWPWIQPCIWIYLSTNVLWFPKYFVQL